jgi:hypothetical protein
MMEIDLNTHPKPFPSQNTVFRTTQIVSLEPSLRPPTYQTLKAEFGVSWAICEKTVNTPRENWAGIN